MTIIIILLLIYGYLYYRPSLDQTNFKEWILWYTYRNEFTKGEYKKERRFIRLKKYKL